MNSQPLPTLFSALGDPTRFKIVQLLSTKQQLCVSEVAQEVGISTAGVSQHMRVLEQAGLVHPQRQGQRMCYQLDYDNNAAVLQLIDQAR